MSALEEYRKEAADPTFLKDDLGCRVEGMDFVRVSTADAAIAELEATIKRLEAERAGDATLRQMYAGLQEQYLAQAELVDPVVRGTVNHLEAKLAERDRMLQLAYEMEELPAEWDPEGYAVWLADLRARAEEGSGDG